MTGKTLLRALTLAALSTLVSTTTALAHGGEHHHEMDVAVQFQAVAGAKAVNCSTPIANLGTTGVTARLQDLRFYVSSVRLVRKNGTTVPLTLGANDAFNYTKGPSRVTLLDFENGKGACATEGDKATNTAIEGTVPEGDYVGVRMYVGVPFALNHTDIVGAPRPLDLAAMSWAWQYGRKFVKIEVSDPAGATGTWKDETFFVHLGSTGCYGNPGADEIGCSVSNRVALRFARFNPETQKIALDVRALLAGNDVTVNRADAPGCMSEGADPECAGVMRTGFALDWKADGSGTGQPLNHGLSQTVFRVRPR